MSPRDSVAHLIDANTARTAFRRHGLDVVDVRADYVRHKPGETTIVSYLFEVGTGAAERGYAHWCERPERADEIWAKAHTFRSRVTPLGTSIRRLDQHTILYPFPSDARLRRMRWYVSPRKLKRTGVAAFAVDGGPASGARSSVEVLRYKPERRVVAAVSLTNADGAMRKLLVRYATTPMAEALAATAAALRSAGVATPEPLLQLEDGRVSVDEFVDGIDLRDAMHAGFGDAAEVGDALHRFHTAPVSAPARSAADDLATAGDGLRGLIDWSPELADRCERFRSRLSDTRPGDSGPEVLLHGDLHDKNLMISQEHVWFVDLERTARGPAGIDLGRLRGIVMGQTVRQPDHSPDALSRTEGVVDHYRSRLSRHRLDDRALHWHTATALVDQALLVTRHLEDDGAAKVEGLLDLAARELDQAAHRSPRRAARSTRQP